MIKSGLSFSTHGAHEFIASEYHLARQKAAHEACGRGRAAWVEQSRVQAQAWVLAKAIKPTRRFY